MTATRRTLGAPSAPVLMVEDDRDLGLALCDLLTDEGFSVHTAADPEEAIALLQRGHVSFILADYLFGSPERSARVARALLDAAEGTPVGLLSAWTPIPPELQRRYAFTLTKPVEPQHLLAAIAPHAAIQGTDPERERVIRRYFEALTERRWSDLVALCTEGVRYHLPGTDAICGAVTGRAAFEAYTAETFEMFPEARFEVTEIAWLPRGVVASYRGRWRSDESPEEKDDGFRESNGAVYFTFDAGLIASIGVRLDVARLRALRGDTDRQTASTG